MFQSRAIWDSSVLTCNDHREFPRLNVWGQATLRIGERPGTMDVPVRLVDISHGGVCFATDAELDVDQRLVLDMKPADRAGARMQLEADVRWTAPDLEAGEYRVGCAWATALTIDDLLQFC
jgi:hypothetical protein